MKTAGFRLSPAAREDIQRIRAWYKKELGPAAAAKTLASIEQGLAQLKRGVDIETAVRSELPLGVYRIIARRHLILFQMDGDKALVLRVVHGARDLPAALDQP